MLKTPLDHAQWSQLSYDAKVVALYLWVAEKVCEGPTSLGWEGNRWFSALEVVCKRFGWSYNQSGTVDFAHMKAAKKKAVDKDFDPLSVDLPKELDTPYFREAWSEWVQHRKEKRKPLRPTMVKQQLREMTDWGVQRSVDAIRYTIGRGWEGLKEQEGAGGRHDETGTYHHRLSEKIRKQVTQEGLDRGVVPTVTHGIVAMRLRKEKLIRFAKPHELEAEAQLERSREEREAKEASGSLF